MKENLADDCPLYFEPNDEWHQTDLGTRVDSHGKTTYHVLTSDRRIGVQFQKVFDKDQKLIRIQKRSRGSASETHFDTATGAVSRIFESSTLPDGSSMMKDIIYQGNEKSTESVVVIAPNGEVVRRVERHHLGSRTIFQGQTEYNAHGTPATTVNHHLDEKTGHLIQREQIQWRDDQHRSLTETFHFSCSGVLTRYSKVLYHADASPFLEEIQEYDQLSQTMNKREISAYCLDGHQTSLDTLIYAEDGEILERKTVFFDSTGKAVATRCSNP